MIRKGLKNAGQIRAIVWLAVATAALIGQSCTRTVPAPDVKSDYRIDMSFTQNKMSKNGDTLFLYFKITDRNGKKVKFNNLDNPSNIDSIYCHEEGNSAKYESAKITKINSKESGAKTGNQKDLVSKNCIFRLLIDRTNINQVDLITIKDAVYSTLAKLPDSTVFISFVDNPQNSRLATTANFSEFESEFKPQKADKLLCHAIIEQLADFAEQYGNTNKECYLLVCTDGKLNFSKDKYREIFNEIKQIDSVSNNNIIIHTFRYGNDMTWNFVFKSLGETRNKEEQNGRFYAIENAAAVSDTIAGFISSDLAYDYRLTYTRRFDNDYIGQNLRLSLYLKTKEGATMYGNIDHTLGSFSNPITGNPVNFFISIFLGILIIFIIYFIIQVVIPYITSKIENFEKKYVVKYKFGEKTLREECSICGDPFEEGEDVVVRCSHQAHYDCWIENGYKCGEYGRKCKVGKEHRFDKKNIFDIKTGPFFRKWAIAGSVGGFIIGIVDYWLLKHVGFMENALKFMVKTFYRSSNYEEIIVNGQQTQGIPNGIDLAFCGKISGYLMAGVLLGFTLTFLFSWINEFRQRKGQVLWFIIGRSCIGAVAGFLSFLIGSVISIFIGKQGAGIAPHIDWIPWILFGCSIAICLSVKTTIKMKNALIGGLISGGVSFICLFTSYIFSPLGMFLSFMLCSAGIGISIVTIHYTAQKYFLKYTHEKKSGEIAIHKWMNESGGRNEVTIGKSIHSVVQMNWDDSERISDIHAKLYVDKKRDRPCLTALEEDMQFDGRDAKVNYPNLLENGKTFMIGNTKFEYIEK